MSIALQQESAAVHTLEDRAQRSPGFLWQLIYICSSLYFYPYIKQWLPWDGRLCASGHVIGSRLRAANLCCGFLLLCLNDLNYQMSAFYLMTVYESGSHITDVILHPLMFNHHFSTIIIYNIS